MEIPTTDVSGVPDPIPAGLTILDVREPHEWGAGHIDGAVHIPVRELPERVGEFSAVEPEQTLVVCRSGGRSAQATAYLLQHGYDAVNLAGGMSDWAAHGRPMVSSSGTAPEVV